MGLGFTTTFGREFAVYLGAGKFGRAVDMLRYEVTVKRTFVSEGLLTQVTREASTNFTHVVPADNTKYVCFIHDSILAFVFTIYNITLSTGHITPHLGKETAALINLL